MTRRGVNWKAISLGGAVAGLAVTGGVRLAGRRVRSRTDPLLDDPLAPPTDVTSRRIATFDGGELLVVDTGPVPASPDAPPVILMHGVTLQWWVWSAAIRLLRDHYRVLTWDMRGHGESRAGGDGVTLEATARDLETVLVDLDLHDAVLVGHSIGGMTMGRLLASHHELAHERVGSLVFVATSAAPLSQAAVIGGLSTMIGLAGKSAARAIRYPRLAYPWREGNLSAAMLSLAFGTSPTARMIDDVRQMEAVMPAQSMAEAAASIALHDVRSDLAQVDLPTEILVGTHDKLTPPAHARELARLIPGANLVTLPGIGHQIMQEQPDAILAAVQRAAERATQRLSVSEAGPSQHVG